MWVMIQYVGYDTISLHAVMIRYVRLKLKEKGFVLYGNDHSPVIPLLLYHPGRVT